MTTLYSMTSDYLAIMQEDLEPDVMKDCLDSIKESINEKGGNIAIVANEMDSDIARLDFEIKRLQNRKTESVNKKARLLNYLKENMIYCDINKITHPLFTITLRKPSKRTVVDDVSLLPDEYVTVKTEVKPDLNKIKKALKEGVSIDGARLEDGETALLIK